MSDRGPTAKFASDLLMREITKYSPDAVQLWCALHTFVNEEDYTSAVLSDQAKSLLNNSAKLIGSRKILKLMNLYSVILDKVE